MNKKLLLLSALVASLISIAPAARAAYINTMQQVGPNVVATGSGSIVLTSLTGPGALGGSNIACSKGETLRLGS